MGSYSVGQRVRLSCVVRDVTNALVDPTTLNLKIQHPSGTEDVHAIGTLTRDSIGNYHYDIVLDAPGHWPYRFEASGTGYDATLEKTAKALPSEFYPS